MQVEAADLRMIRRAIDIAMSEIEAGVADGDIDDSVLFDLDEALTTLDRMLAKGDKH